MSPQKIIPQYNLEKIKFATDGPTFERAVSLYESGKVTHFKEITVGFSAIVLGTKPYEVFVSFRHYDHGYCECYLGKRNILCKHMVAVAIYAVMQGKPLSNKDKQFVDKPTFSDKLGELSEKELSEIKKSITKALRYIKPYMGPSRVWFKYQNSLSEGCRRLSAIVSSLPVSKQTAELLVNLLLRLDKKLCIGGVDDSDGTVGGFIYEVAEILEKYTKVDPSCIKAFKKLRDKGTCFGWEEPLIEIYNKDTYT